MIYRKLSGFLAFLILIFAFNSVLTAQKRSVSSARNRALIVRGTENRSSAPPLSPELQRRVETFDYVWQTIHRNYFDATFSGLNWEKIRLEYRPRALKTVSDAQLHDLLGEMINRLNRSHLSIIAPEVYEAIEKTKTAIKEKEKLEQAAAADTTEDDGEESDQPEDADDPFAYGTFGIGIDLRLIGSQFVITEIEKDSAAETAGLKIGYAIEKINDVPLARMLAGAGIDENKSVRRQLPAQLVRWVLNGEPDTFLTLTFLDETEKPKEIKIRRERIKSEPVSIGTNFPEQLLNYRTASLSDEVGYIKFNVFAFPIIGKFCESLTELKDKKAIIVDLRGNSGGILATMVGLSGMLTESSVDLGTSVYKIGSNNLVGVSKAKNYKGRLVFLVDNQTVSAAEIFTAALRENERALIVGERTAGEALPSVSVELPTGAVLMYPIANYRTRNGNYIEGKGVQPDFEVALDRKTLLAGKDVQLETALKVIAEKREIPKNAPAIDSAAAPPPPPPPPPAVKRGPKLKNLAEVTVKAPPPPAEEKDAKSSSDEKSSRVIAEFIESIGGAAALAKINSYYLKGRVDLDVKGAKSDFEFSAFRKDANRYAEILSSVATGEIREIYQADRHILEADYGVSSETPVVFDISKIEILAPIRLLVKKDFYKTLKYQGVFERHGRKTHVVTATDENGAPVALAFDVETKHLVSYAGQFSTISLADYRKTGELTLPFTIEREGLMKIDLTEVKINAAIGDDKFMKKENCFDRPN